MDDSRSDRLEAALQMLTTRRDLNADAEDLSTQSLEKARQMDAALPSTYRALAHMLGLSDGVFETEDFRYPELEPALRDLLGR